MSLYTKLRNKALKNDLEVEDLLAFAKESDCSGVEVLERLASEFDWSSENFRDGYRIVPLRKWAYVVEQYLIGGYQAMVSLATAAQTRDSHACFVIALLEDLHTTDAVTAVIQICADLRNAPENDLELAMRCATAFNLLLSFKPFLTIPNNQRDSVKGFLHTLLKPPLTDAQMGTVICALRCVGDEDSISLIKSLKPLEGVWAGTQQTAIRQ